MYTLKLSRVEQLQSYYIILSAARPNTEALRCVLLLVCSAAATLARRRRRARRRVNARLQSRVWYT
eukprot:scaffold35276_cov101-Isochrysis_galbana.AAC.2